jgi:hypothetical protein
MDDPIHELLLRLAGRVDDDLLADARELVAVGEDGHALELVTAALAADGTPLPPAVRDELVSAAAAARIDLDADAALAPAGPDTTAHRFSATAHADVPVVAAARELPERLRDGVRLRLTWRQTPAGPAPTPLPQPVLLVETPSDGRPGEVLAYQVGAAMARSGVHVAVEVLTSGRPLTSYHAAALRDSTPLSGDAPPRPASPPEKVESVVAEVVEQVTASHRTAPSEVAPVEEERPGDLFAVDEPAPRPVPMRAWQSERRRRGLGEQAVEAEFEDDVPEEEDDRSPLPSPVPLARRTRSRPVGEPDPITNEGSWTDEWTSGDWAVAETSESASAGDRQADTASPHVGADTTTGGPTTFPTRLGAVPAAGACGTYGASPFRAVTDPDRGTTDPFSRVTDPHGSAAGPDGGASDGPEGAASWTSGPRGGATGPHSANGPHAIIRSMPGGGGAGGAAALDARNPAAQRSPGAPVSSTPGAPGHDAPAGRPGAAAADGFGAAALGTPGAASQGTQEGAASGGPGAAGLGTTGRADHGSPSAAGPGTRGATAFDGPRTDSGAPNAATEDADPATTALDAAEPSGPVTGPLSTDSGAPDDASVGSHALFTDHSTPPQGVDPTAGTPAAPHPTERPTGNGPAHALADADPPTGPLPVVGPPMAEALLKPESLARLSDADRELLTRLQAELGGGANGSNGPNGATPA